MAAEEGLRMVRRAAFIAGFLVLAQADSASAQGTLRGMVTASGTWQCHRRAQVGLQT